MFNRKKVDQNTLDGIRNELLFIQKYADDAKTSAGKNLMELLDATIENTVKEFISDKLDSADSNKEVIFMASCRSKLQTLVSLKNLYQNAEVKKKELQDELNRLLPESEKGE